MVVYVVIETYKLGVVVVFSAYAMRPVRTPTSFISDSDFKGSSAIVGADGGCYRPDT